MNKIKCIILGCITKKNKIEMTKEEKERTLEKTLAKIEAIKKGQKQDYV